MSHSATESFGAVRTCDEILRALASYADRDDAIERLELQIIAKRLEAQLGVREAPIDRGVSASADDPQRSRRLSDTSMPTLESGGP